MAKPTNPGNSSQQKSIPFFAGAVVEAVANNESNDRLSIDKKDANWIRPKLKKLNWNQVFPYQLLVVKRGDDGKYTATTDRIFTLPISPESLQISTPYAITVAATQGGVVEEHNAAPFRMINISGTTGVLPLRGNAGNSQSFGPLQSIFAGTANAGQNFVSSLKKIGGIQNPPNLVDDRSEIADGDIGESSGYFQFHALNYFLERYVAFKKTAEGRDHVLAFAMWKDQHVYLVTPQSFNLSRTSSSPFEYNYSMAFKAWKRVVLDQQGPNAYNYKPAGRDQGVMGQILKGALQARESLNALTNTFKAIGADLDRAIMEPLRQTILFGKDILGVPRSMADIPKELTKSAAGAVVLYLTTKESYDEFGGGVGDNGSFAKDLNDMVTIARGVADAGKLAGAGDYNSTTAVAALDRLFAKDQSYDDFSTGKAIGSYVDPAMRIFEDPGKYMRLFSKIPVSALQLHSGLISQINQDAANIRAIYNRGYAEEKRDQAVAFLAAFENAVGLGDPTYENTYQNGTSRDVEPSDQDYDAVYALNQYIQVLNELAVSDDINQVRVDPTAYVAGLASRSGIAFATPVSKFSVPFPYRGSLEELANTYLGSQDRWIEIADLNGLVPPYVDEVGFDLALLTDANDNRVVVSDSTNLHVGQAVYIISNTKSKTPRKITRIDRINDSYSVVFVDGDPDLAGYFVTDTAILHAWLPNTVNSQMSIYIPSKIEPEFDDFLFKAIPGVDMLDRLFRVAGTDLLLDSNMDLIVTPDGDSPLALGLNAIIQDLKIKVLTKKGSILRHRNFGLPLAVGDSLADINATDIVSSIKDAFVNDSTYTGVRYAKVEINGPVAALTFAVGVRGVADYVPVTISLPQQ